MLLLIRRTVPIPRRLACDIREELWIDKVLAAIESIVILVKVL